MSENGDNVFALPGVDLSEASSKILPADQVLSTALDAGLTDVVVIGRKPNMKSYIAFSDPNLEALLGKLEVAKSAIIDVMLTPEDESDDEGYE